MNRVRRLLSLVILSALCMHASGCIFGRSRDDERKSSMAGTISGPEAQRILAGAQQNLYTDREHGSELTIRLTDSVIHDCSVRRYVWRGFVLKATAYAVAGDNAGAKRTAHEGIQTILAIHQGPLNGDAWTAVRMLLPMYVESSIGAEGHQAAVTTLRAWKTELLAKYSGGEETNREKKANIEAAFDLLEQMAEQGAASRQSEGRLKLLVLQYVQLYNNESLAGASKLFAAKTGRPAHVTRLLARRNTFAAGASRLYIVSAVKVKVPAQAPQGSALSAEAVCDLMATSPAGRARVIKGVRFTFTKGPAGNWLINDIIGDP